MRTSRLHYQGLLTYDPVPELAARWEQPSQTEYIFTLQPGVKWHHKPPANGRPFTMDDVVFNLERMQSRDPFILTRSSLETVEKFEARDSRTLRVTMKEPDASFLVKLSADNMLFIAPEVLERFGGRLQAGESVIGTGPFILTSVQEQVGAPYVRNPDYWQAGLPYLDEVRTVYFGDDMTAWAAFLGGQGEVVQGPGTEVKNYIARQGRNYSPGWFAGDQGTLSFAQMKKKPFDDLRVVKALRLLHDHEEFLRAQELDTGRGRNGSIFVAALHQWDLSHEEYYTYTSPALSYVLKVAKPHVRGFVPEDRMNGRQYQYVWLDT